MYVLLYPMCRLRTIAVLHGRDRRIISLALQTTQHINNVQHNNIILSSTLTYNNNNNNTIEILKKLLPLLTIVVVHLLLSIITTTIRRRHSSSPLSPRGGCGCEMLPIFSPRQRQRARLHARPRLLRRSRNPTRLLRPHKQ